MTVTSPSRGENGMVFVRYLWLTSGVMIVVGVSLAVAASVMSLGPIPLICGLLLLWSGIVKVVVLRIWQKELTNPSRPDQPVVRVRLAQPPRLR